MYCHNATKHFWDLQAFSPPFTYRGQDAYMLHCTCILIWISTYLIYHIVQEDPMIHKFVFFFSPFFLNIFLPFFFFNKTVHLVPGFSPCKHIYIWTVFLPPASVLCRACFDLFSRIPVYDHTYINVLAGILSLPPQPQAENLPILCSLIYLPLALSQALLQQVQRKMQGRRVREEWDCINE